MKLIAKEILDLNTQIHFAIHTSLKEITFPHTHDFFELFYIREGSVIHHINKQKQILKSGTLVLIRPHDEHYYKRLEDICHLYNLAFTENTMNEIINFLGPGFDFMQNLTGIHPPIANITGENKLRLLSKFEELTSIPPENKDIIYTISRKLVFNILTSYFNDVSYSSQKNIPDWLVELNSKMKEINNFSIGLRRMIELSYYSKEHLTRTFKKYMHKTPTEFINELRLNYSANLLVTTDRTIGFIAMEVGYNNISHFNHLFKKFYGITPREYRNQNQRQSIPF